MSRAGIQTSGKRRDGPSRRHVAADIQAGLRVELDEEKSFEFGMAQRLGARGGESSTCGLTSATVVKRNEVRRVIAQHLALPSYMVD